MPRYVIAASPLVKIYLPEWHDRLLTNPELMNDITTDFTFDIPRGSSAFKMKFNKPVLVQSRRYGGDATLADSKEDEVLYHWLTGEVEKGGSRSHETDIYGIVPFDPGVDLVERQEEISRLEELMSDDPKVVAKATKEIARIQKDTADRLKKIREGVRQQSEERIKRAMRTVHNFMTKQWEINEQMKLGKIRPSESEALGAYALNAEIQAAEAKGAKVYGNINKLITGTQGT